MRTVHDWSDAGGLWMPDQVRHDKSVSLVVDYTTPSPLRGTPPSQGESYLLHRAFATLGGGRAIVSNNHPGLWPPVLVKVGSYCKRLLTGQVLRGSGCRIRSGMTIVEFAVFLEDMEPIPFSALSRLNGLNP
ncbi:MAG: hypothetical protein ACYSPI_13525 [Planctomycetota bacterium]